MSISRISSATNNGTTITIGTHAANDSIIIFAYNDGAVTAPTLPSGWSGVHMYQGGNSATRIGWKLAATASETSGTWTNADTLIAVVYRGSSSSICVPKSLSVFNALGGLTQTFLAQIAGTFDSNAIDLWLLAHIHNRSSSNSIDTNVPTGLTNVTSTTNGSSWQTAVHDSNATRTTAWGNTNITVANDVPYRTVMLALLEIPYPASGGSGFFDLNIRGGADQ